MSAALVQRQLALAAVALLAGLMALALGRTGEDEGVAALEPVPAAGGGWYEARVSVYRPAAYGVATACGGTLTEATQGIAHPVLPCGAKLFLSYDGREVATEVVDRGPSGAGRDFDVTEALARDLGLEGTKVVRWRFAGEER